MALAARLRSSSMVPADQGVVLIAFRMLCMISRDALSNDMAGFDSIISTTPCLDLRKWGTTY